MSQAFVFRRDCYIYTKRKERESMAGCIEIMKRNRSVCISGFRKHMPNKSQHSVRTAVYYLLGAGVFNVKQRGEVRIFRFAPRWEKKLRNCFWKGDVVNENNKVAVVESISEKGVDAE